MVQPTIRKMDSIILSLSSFMNSSTKTLTDLPEVLSKVFESSFDNVSDVCWQGNGEILGTFAVGSSVVITAYFMFAKLRRYLRDIKRNKNMNTSSKALIAIHIHAGSLDENRRVRTNARCIELLSAYPHFVNAVADDFGLKSSGYTPFLRACWNNNYDLIDFMLKTGADLNSTTSQGENPIYLVGYRVSKSSYWDNRALNRLYCEGCSINKVNCYGQSILHLAAKAGHVTLVRWLLVHGADTELRNALGLTARAVAIAYARHGSSQHLRTAQLLDTYPQERDNMNEGRIVNTVEMRDGGTLIKFETI